MVEAIVAIVPDVMERELIGPYRILRVVGKGGMGTVYEGVHEHIERRVAIKVLRPEFVANTEYAERFLNEARAVNRVGHPGIVQIHELGHLPDGSAYLVMEYLDGETVGQRLRRRGGRLSVDEAIAIAKDVGDALDAAHGKGIIHRDLKPENIIIVSDSVAARGERSKLLDFGIAKVAAPSSKTPTQRTQVGTVMGTLWYMSPEQLRDTAQVSDRTDVYALGVLMYQLIAGRVPFRADSDVELIAAHLRDVPQDLRQLVPEASEHLSLLVNRMLAKDPAARPAMRQVVRALAESVGPTSSGALPVMYASPESPKSLESTPVPLTLASPRLLSPSARSPAIEPHGEVAPEVPVVVPATLTGSASQRVPIKPRWQLAVLSGIGVVSVGAVLTLVVLLRPKPPRDHGAGAGGVAMPTAIPDKRDVALDRPTPPGPEIKPVEVKPVEIKAPNSTTPPSDAGPVVVGTLPSQLSSAKKPARGCRLENPTLKCLQGTISPDMARMIIASLQSAGIVLCANEELRLQRNGSHFLFEGAISRAPQAKQRLFGTSLKGYLGSASLPNAVTIKCNR